MEDLGELDHLLAGAAPRTFATLNPSASDDDLARLADHVGLDLHPDVKTLLRWHDGASATDETAPFNIAPDFWFTGTAGSAAAVDLQLQVAREIPPDNPRCWQRHWLPIGDDGCGDYLVVDHSPSASYGEVFVYDKVDGQFTRWRWPSVGSVVGEMVEAIRDRCAIGYHEPVFDDGELTWQ